jgi:hypothetical protein
MEYMDVIIHKEDATSANNIPSPSTLKARETPGAILTSVRTISLPCKIIGNMEHTMRNLMIPAANVQPSRTLGFSDDDISMGITRRETKTAKRGLIDTI